MNFVFALLIAVVSWRQVVAVDICSNYPRPDPCLPGGEWDPVINRSGLVVYHYITLIFYGVIMSVALAMVVGVATSATLDNCVKLVKIL